MSKSQVYREVTQRYCSYLDDNVVISKCADSKPDEYQCLSSHLCKNNEKETCKRNMKK